MVETLAALHAVDIYSTGLAALGKPVGFVTRQVRGWADRWEADGTLRRIHAALYVRCREQAERAASPTACIIDSQSVKSAEKGEPTLTRRALRQANRSKGKSATC